MAPGSAVDLGGLVRLRRRGGPTPPAPSWRWSSRSLRRAVPRKLAPSAAERGRDRHRTAEEHLADGVHGGSPVFVPPGGPGGRSVVDGGPRSRAACKSNGNRRENSVRGSSSTPAEPRRPSYAGGMAATLRRRVLIAEDDRACASRSSAPCGSRLQVTVTRTGAEAVEHLPGRAARPGDPRRDDAGDGRAHRLPDAAAALRRSCPS